MLYVTVACLIPCLADPYTVLFSLIFGPTSCFTPYQYCNNILRVCEPHPFCCSLSHESPRVTRTVIISVAQHQRDSDI